MKKATAFLCTVALATTLVATASAGGSCDSGKASYSQTGNRDDIVGIASSAGSFKTLTTALTAADLVDALRGHGPFTVFAPTDEAFAKLPKGTVETLLRPENRDMLVSILTYHVVPGKLKASIVVQRDGAETLNGQRISFETRGNEVMVDDARVLDTDILASNGVIHVIDSVILPEDKNIVEVADNAGAFGTLLAAAEAAGLAGLLSHDGPFTVFAPTDDAFADLPKGTVESLLEPENKHRLVDILKYHVVSGRVYADDAAATDRVRTAEGSKVRFRIRDGRLQVNDANIMATDIQAENGVIHVIDRVLLPSE